MKERIKKLRKALGLTQQKFADALGIKQNTIAQYESGRNAPIDAVISLICREFGVNEEWLRTGEGDMFQQKTRDEELSAFFNKILSEETDFKRRFISVLSTMDEPEWVLLEQMAQRLVDEMQGDTAGQTQEDARTPGVAPVGFERGMTPPGGKKPAQVITALPKVKRRSDGFTEIRVYEQPAAAGLGNYLDEPPYRMEQYPEEIVPEKTDFGVVISGDSMEPEIHNGGTVFVQSCPTLEAGEVGIFILGGKAYCKMLFVDHDKRQVRLVSINKAYDDIVVGENDDMYTLGRVLGQYVPRFQ